MYVYNFKINVNNYCVQMWEKVEKKCNFGLRILSYNKEYAINWRI